MVQFFCTFILLKAVVLQILTKKTHIQRDEHFQLLNVKHIFSRLPLEINIKTLIYLISRVEQVFKKGIQVY